LAGAHDRAIDDFTKALELMPGDPGALYNRGLAYMYKRFFILAIHDFDEAIHLNPENGDAYRNRAIAYVATDSYEPAVRDCTEALRLNPDDTQAQEILKALKHAANR
jgi:tetratricopeptide (TPR) repeat protein